MVSGVWQIFGADCAVILRYCKSKSDKKCRSYLTLKHSRVLNLQFPQFFKGLKRGLLTKIRCSQWLQGMVLDGPKGFQTKKSKSMSFNYKSCISYLVLAHVCFCPSVAIAAACSHTLSQPAWPTDKQPSRSPPLSLTLMMVKLPANLWRSGAWWLRIRWGPCVVKAEPSSLLVRAAMLW